ncbi:hypothetical protein EW146_g7954 [Bondarzewia mesenterica]|uniref:Integrase catalytic domain-containing protein n=1 Tax=Bondarzewia mesenterica TaxID=1095465 RepID=A0A4S4LI57_9AGAM|nr:hypothetical protein EW146_g7954 [Bondarzewia mesenterica]
MDLIVGLPDSQGYDSILVVPDQYTKMVHTMATSSTVTTEGVARLLRDNVWKLHGLPSKITSDRGPQFTSQVMRELNRMLGIKTALSMAYHPQMDGQTERINQEIEQYFHLFVNHRQDDWTEWLPIAEYTYNNKVQASTKVSPFFANYGYHPRMGFELHTQTKVEAVDDFVSRMKKVRGELESALKKA